MNRTFEYCTKYFKQLFTIYGVKNGNYVPLIHCVLPNKETKTYKIIRRHLIKLCADINDNFYSTKVVVDFEKGIHQSLRSVRPLVGIDELLCQIRC